MASSTLQSYLAVDWSILVPAAIALIAPIAATFISKEDGFDKTVQELLQKFLDKKVGALRLLFDSIEFTPTSLGEVRDFKGKRYFTEVDRFSLLERKVSMLSHLHRCIVSAFHYAIVFALVVTLLSLFRISHIAIISTVTSATLIILVIIGIVVMRQIENRIAKLSAMDELKHEE